METASALMHKGLKSNALMPVMTVAHCCRGSHAIWRHGRRESAIAAQLFVTIEKHRYQHLSGRPGSGCLLNGRSLPHEEDLQRN